MARPPGIALVAVAAAGSAAALLGFLLYFRRAKGKRGEKGKGKGGKGGNATGGALAPAPANAGGSKAAVGPSKPPVSVSRSNARGRAAR